MDFDLQADFALEAVAFGILLGILLCKLYVVFVEQCVFQGRGTLHGKDVDSTESAQFQTSFVRTSYGKARVLLKRHMNTPDAPWCVLLHGYAGSLDVYADEQRSNYCNELHKHMGFNVLAYDMYGHGGSDAPDTRFSAELLATQLSELVLHYHLDQFTLVAHSMGCAVAVTFASHFRDRVVRLILLSPSVSHKIFPIYLRVALRIPVFSEVVCSFIIPTFGEGTNVGNKGFLRSCYRLLVTRLESKGSWNQCEWKTLKLCGELTGCRVLILWGAADEVVSFIKAKDQLLYVLPTAMLWACPRGDHMSFADGDSAKKHLYLERIRAFIQHDEDKLTELGVLTMHDYCESDHHRSIQHQDGGGMF